MKKILFSLLFLVSAASFGQQKLQNLKGSKSMKVEFMGKSPKLTTIKPIPNRTKANESDIYIVPNKLTKTGLLKHGPNSAPDPVMQKSTLQTLATGGAGQVLTAFDGGSNEDNGAVNGVMVAPPDTQGDVGPNHYIQMVNSVTTIFDKSGNVLFGPVPNSVFFQNLDPRLAGTNDGDPVVLYDQFADRWIVSQFAVGAGAPYAMLIAVSATSDPLGEYNQYAIDYGDDFPDYPKLGIWHDALYITTRDFANGASFAGFSIVGINRADIIAGVETEAQRFEITNPAFDGILPADADGTLLPPAGEPHYSLFMGGGNELNLVSTTIDFENPANSTLEFGTVPVAPFSFFGNSVPQPNGQTLDALPSFLMYRLQYVNFGTHASLLTNHSVQEVAGGPFGVRWYEFRDTGGAPWEVYQQGTFLPDDGLSRWMGSVAMNENGDIALAYSVSSETVNPSIRFAGQSASESGSGILNIPETSILEGTLSSRGTNRWGDYAMMSIDPVDQDFWFTTEYIKNDADFSGWGTFISEMTFGDPPAAACQDITVEFDAADGSISITPEQIDNGSVGPNGESVSLSLDMDTFDCSNIGENTVTLTATSAEGISASCTATVTVNVIDTEAPVAVCQDILVELNGESVEITAAQIDGGSTDNCAIASLAVDQSVFTELGTFDVTLTVTDFAGFTDTCVATVTVAEGAEIVVNTPSINTAVDVETVSPPVATETFTITNNGGVPLDFTTEVGVTETVSVEMNNALANLDRSIYGGGRANMNASQLSISKLKENLNTNEIGGIFESEATVLDSLLLDSGVDFPQVFVGFGAGGSGLSAATRFTVPEGGFTLNAVRNGYTTEAFGSTEILVQVIAGGATPDLGELLTEKVIVDEAPNGTFPSIPLNTSLNFTEGDTFWVVFHFPMGIDFPQGFDDTIPADNSEDYAFSGDGGATYTNLAGFAFLTRALNTLGGFISLSPGSGTVNPGEDFEVAVTFDAANLGNGVFETPILVSSNDVNTPELAVETSFTVSGVQTPEIQVTPESLEASVDVQVDTPAVAEEIVTITNNGGASLEFDIVAGSASFTPSQSIALANLDRSIYTNPNKQFSKEDFKSVKATKKVSGLKIAKLGESGVTERELANASTVIDSLFYDTGIDFPSSFGGLDNGTALSAAVLFTVDSEEFTLTSVRNAYATEAVQGATILLQVYAGGVTPDQGELLLEQVVTGDSQTGVFDLETLNTPLTFEQGESFWVVHNYPEGIDFPQGQDDAVVNTVSGAYSFSSDGGQTFTLLDGFAFLTRALSEAGAANDNFITLSPQSGMVEPGESVEVTVAFNGATLANGTYDSDLTITSNDPLTPTTTVSTAFTVSGQTSAIAVSEELLLFNDVFVGNSAERSLIISNTGMGELTISSITSDNTEFTATPSSASIASGEELEILLSYAPEATGSSNGIVTITSDASNASSLEVIVNGVGVEGPFAVLDPLENFVTLAQGESTNVDITLTNNGGSPLLYSFPEFTMAAAIANGAKMNKTEVFKFSNFSAVVPSKGFEDTRKGAPVPFSMGTDIVYGYTWIDSDEEGGPIPNFIDIVPFGATDLTEFLNDGTFADGTVEVSLPSPISLYGETHESLFVNANGFVSFEEPTGVTFLNGQIPVDDGVNNIIAPFWNDLEPGVGSGGTVHIATFGEATIVQWTDVPGFVTTGTVTFQVILFPNGTIDVQYEDVSTASFLADATIGVENADGTDGAQVAFNTDFVKDNFAVRFIPPAVPGANFITAVTPFSGVLGVGQQKTISVTVDAQDLNPGTFLDQLSLSSNTVNLESSTAAFELTVEEVLKQDLSFTLVNANTNEAIGPLVDGAVIDLSDFNANSFSVIAVPNDIILGSVIFDFNGVTSFQTENITPYALNGDREGDFNAVEFPVGTNTITATAFSGAAGSGSAGTPLTVTFEVVDVEVVDSPDNFGGYIFPNPVDDVTYFTLEEKTAKVLVGTIQSLYGVVNQKFKLVTDNSGNGNIDMSTLPKGFYILQLRDEKGVLVSQLKIAKN